MLERIGRMIATLLGPLADRVADRIADRLEPKLPDLSDLDDQIVAKLPDLSNLPEQVLTAVASVINGLGLGGLVKFDSIKGLPLVGDQIADIFQGTWNSIFGKDDRR
ncbi:hypothetical protein [Mycolicibacterium peregrinum]|uniref:Uncharacterized protein n=1 Tax=Mycolicibacterium peregrinum TaxID=43304 RepID=A0A4Z0HJS8_MYCPR|nr:hypothetical protein [Mycolicibacterium peregrinum]TGB37864.1 hypothetical protein EJD98_25270 [Mycolicibacterium peregrinum]TGB38117.1 hypothetical protein EJD94_25295 [Mycolicibacterium peregrinum]